MLCVTHQCCYLQSNTITDRFLTCHPYQIYRRKKARHKERTGPENARKHSPRVEVILAGKIVVISTQGIIQRLGEEDQWKHKEEDVSLGSVIPPQE